MKKLIKKLIKKLVYRFKRNPDQVIGQNYLWRWYLIPKNEYFNIYLHRFGRSDYDRALHDHPWSFVSVLLKGEFIEHNFNGVRFIHRFTPVFRRAKFAHRLELVKGPVWTLIITGPKTREWGFFMEEGWKIWWKVDGAKE